MKKAVRNLALLIALVGIPFGLYTQQQNIFDWWVLRDYTPPTKISELAVNTSMTDYGKRLFYVNKPQIENKQDFHVNCTLSEQTIVLGCYVESQGIFLYEVTDARLTGIEEVTAAHEMLHAAYERLSGSDKSKIDSQLESALATLNNQRIKDTIEQYRARDPSIVSNELHSIMGTEVLNLSPELEAYYSKYFTNRKKVVDYSEKYESVFSNLKKQVENYDAQLADLKKQIDAFELEIKSLGSSLEYQRIQLDELLAQNNVALYNSKVPKFNQQVLQYNAKIGDVKNLINQYNDIVKKRNDVATEQKSLINAIDTRTINTK